MPGGRFKIDKEILVRIGFVRMQWVSYTRYGEVGLSKYHIDEAARKQAYPRATVLSECL